MPTVIIEGPRLSPENKKDLVQKLTPIVAYVYDWKVEDVIVIIRENEDENVARGGILLSERKGRVSGQS
ncbi:MAG TPA: tautomerase family protein [Candidatus Omnitrophota bacterium]|nr:tautomerase family protein [Candidatus Omnitrophota bacterium]